MRRARQTGIGNRSEFAIGTRTERIPRRLSLVATCNGWWAIFSNRSNPARETTHESRVEESRDYISRELLDDLRSSWA